MIWLRAAIRGHRASSLSLASYRPPGAPNGVPEHQGRHREDAGEDARPDDVLCHVGEDATDGGGDHAPDGGDDHHVYPSFRLRQGQALSGAREKGTLPFEKPKIGLRKEQGIYILVFGFWFIAPIGTHAVSILRQVFGAPLMETN